MDRANEDDRRRQLLSNCGYTPVVPPKSNRMQPWKYDEAIYMKHNEIERMFRFNNEKRCVATRYDKLDVTYLSFVCLAFINIAQHDFF